MTFPRSSSTLELYRRLQARCDWLRDALGVDPNLVVGGSEYAVRSDEGTYQIYLTPLVETERGLVQGRRARFQFTGQLPDCIPLRATR